MLINLIPNIRKHKNLNQDQLAEKSGVAVSTIRNAERNIRKITFSNLEKIADALDVSIKDLFMEEKTKD